MPMGHIRFLTPFLLKTKGKNGNLKVKAYGNLVLKRGFVHFKKLVALSLPCTPNKLLQINIVTENYFHCCYNHRNCYSPALETRRGLDRVDLRKTGDRTDRRGLANS